MEYFQSKPYSWQEILEIISLTTIGLEISQKFDVLFRSEKISVKPYPLEVKEQLLLLHPSTPIGAAFMTDGQLGEIYLDLEQARGLLAPFLFHEMVHSLDESLWRAAKTKLSPFQRKELIFQSECRAFSAQNKFILELKGRFPVLVSYYQNYYPDLKFLNQVFQPHEVAELYAAKGSSL